ncbi:type VII secretion-associated serine protease mycosin [Actinocatenispora rupis]|uniref:type VII secretion-associated serine protease mycosin n=1 Tax=Actinocatenispora rupis TaxID=519421 RepID=UPI001EF361E5|nr:type VII secretion-associated serine protease mycosin [Actinocatenispora rupis]
MPNGSSIRVALVRAGVAAGLVVTLAAVAVAVAVAVPAAAAPKKHHVATGSGTVAAQQSCHVPAGATHDNPLQRTPWGLDRVQPQRAWPLSRGQGVKVAVIDSGVSPDNVVLKNAVYEGGHDYLADGNGTCDQYGHGTVVAGIIAGRDDTGTPFYGVAPDAEILPYRVLVNDQKGSDATPGYIADAIRRATDAGARVVNMSLTTVPTDALRSAVKYALAHDVVLVAAAGNEGNTDANGEAQYPAALPGVLAVGGIDEKGGHVGSSSTGNYLELAGPGKDIDGPAPAGGGFITFPAGTSFATPYVAGVAALIRAYEPKLSAEQVRERILRTADHPPQGWNATVGYGVVNPYRALTATLKDDAGAAPAGSGDRSMADPRTRADPLRTVKLAAGITAAALLALAVLALIGSRVVPRGRRRDWRAGRAAFVPDGADRPTGRRPAAPDDGRPVAVTAPSSRSNTPSGPGGSRTGQGGFAGTPRALPGGARALPSGGRG